MWGPGDESNVHTIAYRASDSSSLLDYVRVISTRIIIIIIIYQVATKLPLPVLDPHHIVLIFLVQFVNFLFGFL